MIESAILACAMALVVVVIASTGVSPLWKGIRYVAEGLVAGGGALTCPNAANDDGPGARTVKPECTDP